MRIQQSFQNPYSRLQQKRYGYNHPQTPWLPRNGARVVSLLGIIVAAIIIIATIRLIPGAIEYEQNISRRMVANVCADPGR